jgi:uncharacterized RDD family membrane protein YckC
VRILAGLVDLLLVGLPVLFATHWYLLESKISGLSVLAALVFQTTYGAAFEASRWRATIGKRLLRLQVVGRPLGESWAAAQMSRCIARNLWKLIYFPSPVAVVLINEILDDENRGYHDRKAGTTVIHAVAEPQL